MASTKDIFEAKTFQAGLFGSGLWRGTGVDVAPGGTTLCGTVYETPALFGSVIEGPGLLGTIYEGDCMGKHRSEWLIDEDNRLVLDNVIDADTEDKLQSGTVNWSLKNSANTEVASGTLTYSGTPGKFTGVVDKDDMGLTAGARYKMEYTLSVDGKDGRWQSSKIARYRGRK